MRKLLYIILVILLLPSSCSRIPKEWNNLSINNLGDLKIPNTWIVSEIDDKIIIADKNASDDDMDVYAIGMYFDDYDRDSSVFRNESIGEIYIDGSKSSKNVNSYSNSAIFETNYCYVNGEGEWLDCICLYNIDENNKSIDYIIIFLKESIGDKTVKTIAQSYSHYD